MQQWIVFILKVKRKYRNSPGVVEDAVSLHEVSDNVLWYYVLAVLCELMVCDSSDMQYLHSGLFAQSQNYARLAHRSTTAFMTQHDDRH